MNIFEQLIDELKEENLLEETVIENNGTYKSENKEPLSAEQSSKETEENPVSANNGVPETTDEVIENLTETGFEFEPSSTVAEKSNNYFDEEQFQSEDIEKASDEDLPIDKDSRTESEVTNKNDFFYRRANEEVTSLQMVELVLSGVERDQMKIIPNVFDDMAVKTALHKFKQVSQEENSTEQSQIEFQLMQETENWYSALSLRDKRITVGHLRRFCETTRPALSSQALLSLARFYRNAPYSESVRAKFDLIITRLLTREIGENQREMVFNRDEIIEHLEGLYAEWSSVSLYSPDKDDSNALLSALKFEDFITEINEMETFDDLIKSDFFNRLRIFKESTSENFFAPLITTSAIECNVKVGNRYVELLNSETINPEILIKKYGVIREEAISDSAGKSLHLAQLLYKKDKNNDTAKQTKTENVKGAGSGKKSKKKAVSKDKKGKTNSKSPFAINKWLLIVAAIVILGNIGLFLFSGVSDSDGQTKTVIADKVNLENSVLKEHLQSARMSNNTFYGRIAPSWNNLTQEDKELFLQKIMSAGKERGFTTVHLLNDEGRPVGYGKGDKVQVSEITSSK